MAKPASDLTLAIRGLCEETDGAITHSEARPRLKKLGFTIRRDPGRQSPELTAFDSYAVDYDDTESIDATANACGFSADTVKSVIREYNARQTFKSERNNFDVTKNIWKKNRASGKPTPSRKPVAASRNARAKTAAKSSQPEPARPRGKRVAAPAVLQTGAEMEALAFVESNGGLSAVEATLEKARETVSELEQVVETVAALTKRLSAAA